MSYALLALLAGVIGFVFGRRVNRHDDRADISAALRRSK